MSLVLAAIADVRRLLSLVADVGCCRWCRLCVVAVVALSLLLLIFLLPLMSAAVATTDVGFCPLSLMSAVIAGAG
jgi:hypothetical protein